MDWRDLYRTEAMSRPAPFFDDGAVTLYRGDCQLVLPQVWEPGMVLVTDPPYELAGREAVVAFLANFENAAVFGWPEDLVRIAMAAGRVPDDWLVWWPTNAGLRSWGPKGQTPRESEHVAIWGDVRWVHGAPTSRNADKLVQGSRPLGHKARGEVKRSPLGRRWGDVWRDASPGLGFQSDKRLHPNEKPLHILTRLLQVVADGPVIDPFAGSGTTLVAAKALGRRAIGIEINPDHCRTATTRLLQETLGLDAA